MHYMLTNHLGTLSKPVSPGFVSILDRKGNDKFIVIQNKHSFLQVRAHKKGLPACAHNPFSSFSYIVQSVYYPCLLIFSNPSGSIILMILPSKAMIRSEAKSERVRMALLVVILLKAAKSSRLRYISRVAPSFSSP